MVACVVIVLEPCGRYVAVLRVVEAGGDENDCGDSGNESDHPERKFEHALIAGESQSDGADLANKADDGHHDDRNREVVDCALATILEIRPLVVVVPQRIERRAGEAAEEQENHSTAHQERDRRVRTEDMGRSLALARVHGNVVMRRSEKLLIGSCAELLIGAADARPIFGHLWNIIC